MRDNRYVGAVLNFLKSTRAGCAKEGSIVRYITRQAWGAIGVLS